MSTLLARAQAIVAGIDRYPIPQAVKDISDLADFALVVHEVLPSLRRTHHAPGCPSRDGGDCGDDSPLSDACDHDSRNEILDGIGKLLEGPPPA